MPSEIEFARKIYKKELNLNNEKTMREKAEQMAKNAEMKIQQAKEKERKYQENLEFQKKNNPNFRDYDENPLTIQSYEEFFVLSLFIPSLAFSACFIGLLEKLYKPNSSDFHFLLIILPIGWICIAYLFQKTHFSHHKIKFTNKCIEFYDYGKLKRQCEIIENKMAKPFFIYCDVSDKKQTFVFVYFLVILIGFFIYKPIMITIVYISFCFSYILIKFLFYLFLNKTLKGFSVFSFIQISNPIGTAFRSPLSIRYFVIYLYNDEIFFTKKYKH